MLKAYVEQALRRTGIRPSRARGQHFLIDDATLAAVVQAARLDGSEVVVEIGPGLGTLTQSLATRCRRLHAFELDDRLSRYLQQWVLPEHPNITLHDVAFNKYVFEPVLEAAEAAGHTVKIVTNLPYQISGQFLQTLAEYSERYALAVVMLQHEVAQRCTAGPGDASFGSLSVYLQSRLRIEWVAQVPAEAFDPPPKVRSAVLSFAPLPPEQRLAPRNPERFSRLVRGLFRHRRKQLGGALMQALPHLGADGAARVLAAAGLDPQGRAQTLSHADFVRLADAVEESA